MQVSIEISVDDMIAPHLAEVIRGLDDKTPVLTAMGTEMEAMAKESFSNPELRPIAWAPVKKKSGAPLIKSGMLWESIRVTGRDDDSVTVGTDRPYGVFQFFGTKPYRIEPRNKKAIAWPGGRHPVRGVNHPGLPPRPFLPVHPDTGEAVPEAAFRLQAIIADWVALHFS